MQKGCARVSTPFLHSYMLLFILCFHSLSGFIEALFQFASQVVLAVHIQFLADMAALAGDVRFTLVQFVADFLQHLAFQHHLADHSLTVGKVGTYQIPSLLAQFAGLQLFCGTVQDILLLFGVSRLNRFTAISFSSSFRSASMCSAFFSSSLICLGCLSSLTMTGSEL